MDICGHVWICGRVVYMDIMWICVVPRKGKENEIEFIKGER